MNTLRKILSARSIVLNVVLIDVCGQSYERAAMLSQLCYWSDRTIIAGGWIAKTHHDWQNELRLKRSTAVRASKWLAEKGLIETKVKKFNGTPTAHYRVNWSAVNKQINDCTMDCVKMKQSKKAGDSIVSKWNNGMCQNETMNGLCQNETIYNIDVNIDVNKDVKTDADASAHTNPFLKSSLSSTLAHNTSKLTDSDAKKSCAKKSELERFYAEHDCTELPKFQTQPALNWFAAKRREIGQDRMTAILLELERYCREDNPNYTIQRKSLSRCFLVAQKKTEPKLTIEAKQVWNDVFQDLFGEPMTFTNSESKKMGQLAELVRAGADKFAQRNYERNATDTEILDGLRKFLQRLPARFTKSAADMNIHFIVPGFQKIRLDIAGAKKASLAKGEYRNCDAVQAANNAKAIIF